METYYSEIKDEIDLKTECIITTVQNFRDEFFKRIDNGKKDTEK